MAEVNFEKILVSDFFKFVVGIENQVFYLHSALVALQSEALDVLVNGGMREAQERCVQWASIDVPTFIRFGQFIYTEDYEAPPHKSRNNSDLSAELIQTTRVTKGKKGIRSIVPYAPPPTNGLLWDEFRSLYPDASVTIVRQNEANDDYTDVFLGHAQVYVFAECYGVEGLQTLSLGKLRRVLESFALFKTGIKDVLRLIRYCYDNTAGGTNEDRLRRLVTMYTACNVETLWEDEEFADLVETNGEFAKGLVRSMLGRLN
ncbi:hypothetical protein CLIM01_13479 [Colletotrichum limetticola]|uniref:BTB domain-containing protein n=1 Tax=Colletotrichum limetticola TaxID=1209924 RepID=A0ABQ9PDE4_9PEZI|nr:hypothetical protein CLIM01_13479 [Colletotrichum limetticola]